MKVYELLEQVNKPLAVDFTTQCLEDKKQAVQTLPHIEEIITRFVEFKINNPTRPISKKDYRLHGILNQYSHVHLSGDIFLIYIISSGVLLLISIVNHDDIKPRQQKQLRARLDTIVKQH